MRQNISESARYVVLDVETTGLSPQRGHRIIEIGAVMLQDLRITEEFQTLINIETPIPETARRIHGITDEMLIGQPSPAEAVRNFLEFIKESVLVAHNAKFDIGFIKSEFYRLGLGFDHKYFCTLKMSRRLFPRLINHKLPTVYSHICGPIPEDTRLHRALDDARLTAKVWVEIMKNSVSNSCP